MKDFIPLFQTSLWIILILIIVLIFRQEIALLRRVLFKRLEEGVAVELGPLKIGELRAELKSVRKDLEETNERISKLFLTTMAPMMYENLKKLATGHFGEYTMSKGLERELYHLRDLGYIDVPSIKGIPNNGPNLTEHVKVTSTGRLFVELRESVVNSNKVV